MNTEENNNTDNTLSLLNNKLNRIEDKIDAGSKEYLGIRIGKTTDGLFVAYTGSVPDQGNEGYGKTEEESVADYKSNLLK